MYGIRYAKSAAKFLKKLDKTDQERILAVIERARIRPEAHFERLVGEKLYKLRAGDYRVIADILPDRVEILVVKIGHRRNIYK